MIVYVETNFILELAYLHEEHESADAILKLAESKALNIVVPAYCVIEAQTARQNKAKQRDHFAKTDLQNNVRELSRSASYADLASKSSALTLAFVNSIEEEKARLNDALARIAACSTVLPLTDGTLKESAEYARRFGLSIQDATVLASVVTHIATIGKEPRCFISEDQRAFRIIPDVRDLLKQKDCLAFYSFARAFEWVSHVVGEDKEA